MPNPEYKVPAELLNPIKEALIKLGYANANTPLSVVQDAYYKYIMIRQTGFNPHIPYALGLLPKELQDQLDGDGNTGGGNTGGGNTGGGDGTESATVSISNVVVAGSRVSFDISATDIPMTGSTPFNLYATVIDANGSNMVSNNIANPVSGQVYQVSVTNLATGSANIVGQLRDIHDGQLGITASIPVNVPMFTPVAFDTLTITQTGFSVEPVPAGGVEWSTTNGYSGTLTANGDHFATFPAPLNVNTTLNVTSKDQTRSGSAQFLLQIGFETTSYDVATGEATVTSVGGRTISSSATVSYDLGGTPKSFPLVPNGDGSSATATIDIGIPNDTQLVFEDTVSKQRSTRTVFN